MANSTHIDTSKIKTNANNGKIILYSNFSSDSIFSMSFFSKSMCYFLVSVTLSFFLLLFYQNTLKELKNQKAFFLFQQLKNIYLKLLNLSFLSQKHYF